MSGTDNSSAIDLTNLEDVKSWLTIGQDNTSDDGVIQDCITALSVYVLRATGRGPMNGSIPTVSPFVQPVAYDEWYDGSGTERQKLRNWPATAVASLTINGVAVQQSTSFNSPGWLIDGDGKFLVLRGGAYPNVTRGNWSGSWGRGSNLSCGFTAGTQNVEIVYTAGFAGVPLDLQMMARKVVALNYKRASWIGARSRALAGGAGTIFYTSWEMDLQDRAVLDYYKRVVT